MTLRPIIDAVAHDMRVLPADLVSAERTMWLRQARDVACWLAYHRKRWTLTAIGRALGNRHHTTIMAAVARADACRDDPYWRRRIERIAAAADCAPAPERREK